MYRATALACGLFLCILGFECFFVERATLNLQSEPGAGAPPPLFLSTTGLEPERKELDVPDWAPWSFASTGIVVMLYSFTLPKRVAQQG